MTAVAVVGGLIIAGLLSDPRFRLQIETFRGVKVALGLPMILTGGIAFRRHFLSVQSEEGWRAFLAAPLSRAEVLGVLALGPLLGLVLLRAGNGSTTLAPSWELPLRAWLDQVLLARPRFKEAFLVGPALMMLGSGAWGSPRIRVALSLVAVVGPVSIVNSFCHAHTPVLLSLLRTFHGLWLGVLLGAAGLMLLTHRGMTAPRVETLPLPGVTRDEVTG